MSSLHPVGLVFVYLHAVIVTVEDDTGHFFGVERRRGWKGEAKETSQDSLLHAHRYALEMMCPTEKIRNPVGTVVSFE